jgi:hypothetical protein
MRINKALNLVIPVDRDDGSTIYVHATPIEPEVFDRYFLVISKTFAAIYSEGLGPIAGPRVAAKLLKKVAIDAGQWDGPEGVEVGLVNEIHRLANVLVPSPNGWQTVPYHDAYSQKLIDAEDLSEISNALAFFTVAFSMHRREERRSILEGASKIWGSQITSSNCSEFASSLPKLTATANSGGTAAVSSVAR